MARYYCCWCKSHLDAAKFIGITYLVLHLVVLGVWLAILEGAVPDGQITDYVYPSRRDEILGTWEFGNPEISHLFKPNLTYPNLPNLTYPT